MAMVSIFSKAALLSSSIYMYIGIIFQITKQDEFAEVVRDIAEYTMRDLLNPVSFLKTINLHIDQQLTQGILV